MFKRQSSIGLADVILLAVIATLAGCRSARTPTVADILDSNELEKVIAPSNYRHWSPELSRLPTAELSGDSLTVRNIRYCKYLTDEDFVADWYDKTFDLNAIRSVDYIVVPFKAAPTLAHTMLSFGFEDGTHLAVSVEIRAEQGEKYSPVKGSLRQYEIMYVLADERDVIPLRTKYRGDDVFLYPTRATPEQARELLLDVAGRINQLAVWPEFYDSLTNNCTTNIVAHINRINPGRVPMHIGVLMPGLSDRLAYSLGLLDTDVSFDETKRRANITQVANRNLDSPDFSRRIRMR